MTCKTCFEDIFECTVSLHLIIISCTVTIRCNVCYEYRSSKEGTLSLYRTSLPFPLVCTFFTLSALTLHTILDHLQCYDCRLCLHSYLCVCVLLYSHAPIVFPQQPLSFNHPLHICTYCCTGHPGCTVHSDLDSGDTPSLQCKSPQDTVICMSYPAAGTVSHSSDSKRISPGRMHSVGHRAGIPHPEETRW